MNFKPLRIVSFVLLACSFALAGCASWSARNTHRSTSVVDFLYPAKQPFVEPSIPTLSLPLRVGVAFVPPSAASRYNGYASTAQFSEAARAQLMQTVREQFKALPYVKSIELIQTTYMRPGGSFENLDQLRSLLGIDVIVLLAYDQQQNTTDSWLTLSYWTIVGAYTVPAQKNSTATIMEAVVYDIASRKLLFRAAGTNVTNCRSTLVGMGDQLSQDSAASYTGAAGELSANLHTELGAFKTRIKEAPEEIKVTAKPGYSLAAGAFSGKEMLFMIVFALIVSVFKAGVAKKSKA